MTSEIQTPKPSLASYRKVYGMGLFFVLGFGVGIAWMPGNGDLSTRFVVALVMGGVPMLLFFGLPHFLLQWLIMKAIKPRQCNIWKCLIVLNLPIAVLAVYGSVRQAMSTRPIDRFQQMIVKEVPASVSSIEQSGLIGMGLVSWTLRFKISPADLDNMVAQGGFSSEKETEYEIWREKVRSASCKKFDPDLNGHWEFYVRNPKGEYDRLFFNRQRGEALFLKFPGG